MLVIKYIFGYCLLLLGTLGCSSKYEEANLLADLRSKNTLSILSRLKDKQVADTKKIEKNLIKYAQLIQQEQLSILKVTDPFALNSSLTVGEEIKEVAYIFLDHNNNVAASINFVYEQGQDDLSVISIAFRNSAGKLQCALFPGDIPLACVNLPIPLAPNLEELKQIYPRKVGNFELVPLSHLLTGWFGNDSDDPPDRIIAFNVGNQIIGEKLPEILSHLGQRINLKKIVLAESTLIGEPTINIGFDPKFYARKDAELIKTILEDVLLVKVQLIPTETTNISTSKISLPVLSIGYANSENKVIYLFEDKYFIELI